MYKPRRAAGKTLSEYAFILSLVALAALASTSGLGASIYNLLSGNVGGSLAQGGQTRELFGILSPKNGGGGATTVASGGGSLPMLPVDQFNYANSNATSIMDNQVNEVGTVRLASTMVELAKYEPDPEKQQSLNNMAKWMYYIGAAQGGGKQVPGLAIPTEYGGKQFIIFGNQTTKYRYTTAMAQRDIDKYTRLLQQEMASYDRSEDDGIYARAEWLANMSMEIGQLYIQTSKYANNKDREMYEESYDQKVAYDALLKQVSQVLADNKVDIAEVKIELENAQEVDDMAPAPAGT